MKIMGMDGSSGSPSSGVEIPSLGVEQVVEKERTVPGAVGGWQLRIKTASPLGFFAVYNRPTDLSAVVLAKVDGLSVFEDSGS